MTTPANQPSPGFFRRTGNFLKKSKKILVPTAIAGMFLIPGVRGCAVRLPGVSGAFPDAAYAGTRNSIDDAFQGRDYTVIHNPKVGMSYILKLDSAVSDKLADPLVSIGSVPDFTIEGAGQNPNAMAVGVPLATVAAVVADPLLLDQGLAKRILLSVRSNQIGDIPGGRCAVFINPDFAPNVSALLKDAGVSGVIEAQAMSVPENVAAPNRITLYFPKAGTPMRGIGLKNGIEVQ